MTSSSNVPAGMYPDPENPGQSRFWNGSSWEAPGAPAVLPAAEVAQVTKKPVWKRKWFLITAGIFAVLVLGAIGSAGSSTKTTNQPSAAALPITPSVPALVVPNLVGLPAEQVVPALTALGLTLGPTTYGPSDAPNNQVISQIPAAGTPGVAGGAVSVILSSGPAQPAPAAPAPVEAAPADPAPAPVDAPLGKSDYAVSVKTVSKQCFGSAGCNVVVRISVSGSAAAQGVAADVTITIKGGEDGPVIETISIDENGEYRRPEVLVSTPSSGTKITAKVTDVEVA